jgi:predicted Zn-dependent protease
MMRRTARLLAILGVAAALLVSGCATNPVSKRSEFVLMSEEQELALGRQMHAEVLQEYGEYKDPKLQAYVQQVGERVAALSDRPQLIYRFTVLDSPEVNAFALPGGYIYITRGIMAYFNSEAELAAVLGHEIGHVTARHAVRQYTAAQATGILATIGSIFVPGLGSYGGSQLINVLGTALLRGYGREHELEADGLGARYMAKEGYDPMAMLNVLSTLKNQETLENQIAKQEGREPRVYHGVFSTHPDSDTRLQEVVGAARQLQGGGAKRLDRDRYFSNIDGMVVGDSPHEGFVRGNAFYHPDLGFGLRFPKGWSVKNYPDRIVFVAPGGKALMQMGAEDLNKRMSPKQFMTERMGLKKLSYDGAINPSGLEGYTAVAPARTSKGTRDARFSVIFFNNKAYMLAGLVEPGGSVQVFDNAFLDTASSFHPLTAQERETLKPLRLRIAPAAAGDTFGKLAGKSPYPTNAEARLRLLNGYFRGGEVPAGDLMKIVE